MNTSLSRALLFTDVRAVILAAISPDVTVIIVDQSQALESAEVVRAQVNRVPMPREGFILLTPLSSTRLSTNVTRYTDTQKSISQSMQYAIQIDCYGVQSNDWANVLSTLFRDEFACDMMTVGQPLHADDPVQMPLINGEMQFEERWTMTALFAYTPVVVLPMPSALEIGEVSLFAADVKADPEPVPPDPPPISTETILGFDEATDDQPFGSGTFYFDGA